MTRTSIVRSDSVVARTPPRASRWSARPPSPRFRLSILFLFRGGILFEIEWAETGLGRFVLLNKLRYTFDMTSPAKKLGENLRKIRLAKGMTQGDLCEKIGADVSYISNVENGNKNPTLSTIERIAKALNVSIEELMK